MWAFSYERGNPVGFFKRLLPSISRVWIVELTDSACFEVRSSGLTAWGSGMTVPIVGMRDSGTEYGLDIVELTASACFEVWG